ncbi:ankyrin repeat domain-containing protein SOWAHA-like [Schistocerca gregaria]|uniref:ankyrin repeat domain-containing protein SOWAHA-like n=1 Tax=Schistocerca gregaria TaxID=7010 RepID=UPI00211DDDCA|nr:ankyrin repeat domain-containing protein SOWAHA-like [Schistocerca gregaria]
MTIVGGRRQRRNNGGRARCRRACVRRVSRRQRRRVLGAHVATTHVGAACLPACLCAERKKPAAHVEAGCGGCGSRAHCGVWRVPRARRVASPRQPPDPPPLMPSPAGGGGGGRHARCQPAMHIYKANSGTRSPAARALKCLGPSRRHGRPRRATPKQNSLHTALHWGAKHGNAHIVKMMAGTYHADVNARSKDILLIYILILCRTSRRSGLLKRQNGGYTPLHLATQFGYEEIANLLVNAYGADQNLRDYSGRKARQYQASQDTSVSADTFRKIKARKKQAEKDLGFLRIGSLNVRVKKTTEAFSNFLGVGINSDKIHKTWGSADNIQQVDRRRMPPPKAAPLKKRRSRHGAADFTGSYSTPSTPPSQSRTANSEPGQDSDSDSACGFGNNWQGTV